MGSKLCGLPLRHVIETMRPLPLERLANMPSFVSGVSLIRGRPTPVLAARELLGSDETTRAGRYVTLKVAERNVALAVDAVVGVRDIDRATLTALPPLLRAAQDHAVEAVARLDAELLLVLEHGKLLEDAQLTALSEARAS